jgi:hypothetical protein
VILRSMVLVLLAFTTPIVGCRWEGPSVESMPKAGSASRSTPLPTAEPRGLKPDVGRRFIPDVEIRSGTALMPVVFPDGTRELVTYPAELHLAASGAFPRVSLWWDQDRSARHAVGCFFGVRPSATFAAGGDIRVIRRSAGRSVSVTALESGDEYLIYRLSSWTVLVPVFVRDERLLAASVTVTETEEGYPVIEAKAPFHLAEGFGEDEGPQVAIGDTFPAPDETDDVGTIFLAPGCGLAKPIDVSPSGEYASMCVGDRLFASVYRTKGFIRAVTEGLRIA